MQTAPTIAMNENLTYVGYALIAIGQLFALSSLWMLGVTGTYLGDYFGILMSERLVCFPFNVLDDPMYYGSTMTFLGSSLIYKSPSGLVLTASIYIMYLIAIQFEGPFTARIYAEKDNNGRKKK